MHNENEYPISESRNKELEANQFASQFLMPEKHIKNSLHKMKISDLAPIKKYWLTSKSSIIRRALDLGIIDKAKYTYFNIELSRNGEKKRENEIVYIDKPTHIQTAYSILKTNLNYTDTDISNYFALPTDITNEIFNNKPIFRIL